MGKEANKRMSEKDTQATNENFPESTDKSKILKHAPVFYNFRKTNNTLSKVSIRAFYAGKNRNRSIIPEEVAVQLAESMRGTAIVGNYAEEQGDFEEHSGEYGIHEGKIVYKHKAQPYGFIAPDADIWVEDVLDEDGQTREYYCTEGYLWTKRYPEIERVLENRNNQSMELDDSTLEGEWLEDEEGLWYKINYAAILGLAILGEDVNPCFESAAIHSFAQYNKEEWSNFNLLVSELLEDLREESESQKSRAKDSKEGELIFSNLELEKLYKVYTASIANKFNGGGQEMSKKLKFELSHGKVRSLISKQLNPYDEESDTYAWNFGVLDVYDDHTIAYDYEEEKYYKFGYTKTNDEVTIGEPVQVFSEFLTDGERTILEEMRESYNQYKETVEGLEGKEIVDATEYSEMKEAAESLEGKTAVDTVKYEALVEKAESVEVLENQIKEYSETVVALETEKKESLLVEFDLLGEEVLAPFKEKLTEFSYTDLEKELSLLGYRNKVNYSSEEVEGVVSYSGDGDAKLNNLPEWAKTVVKKQNKMNEEE